MEIARSIDAGRPTWDQSVPAPLVTRFAPCLPDGGTQLDGFLDDVAPLGGGRDACVQ